jgi:hypothetical protein
VGGTARMQPIHPPTPIPHHRRVRQDDQPSTVGLGRGARLDTVAGDHARPRLHQRGFRVAKTVGTAQQVAPRVAVQHRLAEDRVLRVAAVQRVADRLHPPVHIHIRLHDIPLADLKPPAQRLADLHDCAADFVPHHGGMRAQVAGNFGMRLAQAQDFQVAKADADGVDTHEYFVRRGLGHGQAFRLAIAPQILQPRPVQVPAEVCGRQRHYTSSGRTPSVTVRSKVRPSRQMRRVTFCPGFAVRM